MTSLITAALLILLTSSSVIAQNGWRMEGFNPSRTNVSKASGPASNPTFEVIASDVSGGIKRIADDGSLILTDGTSVSWYSSGGQLKWRRSVVSSINGSVVDLAVAASGTVYVSSANTVSALDPNTGEPSWHSPFVSSSSKDSGPLVIGPDGTIYFHTGGSQEKLTAIAFDGTPKWEYSGNTGTGSSRPIFSSDGSISYLFQLSSGLDGRGKAVGLSAATGRTFFEAPCDVRSGAYTYSTSGILYTGDANNNLLRFPSDLQSCSVSTSSLTVTDTAAVPTTGPVVVRIALPGTNDSYAAIDSQGRTVWSRIEPLTGGFADTPSGEGSGTFFAIAPQTNEIVAIRIATGDELWRQRFGARMSGVLLGGDGNLYLVAGTDLIRGGFPHSAPAMASKVTPTAHVHDFAAKAADGAVVFAAASTSGLVAAYGFNEGTGTTTADFSGNGFTGTLANGAAWTTGKNSNGVTFDGLDKGALSQKITIPSTLDITALPFTLEAWVKPVDFADWRAYFSKRSAYAPNQMRFDAGLQISTGLVYVTTSSSTSTFAYAPPLNAWTHLAIDAETTGTKLYVNGVLQDTQPAITLGTGSTALAAIGGSADDDDHFAGVIDDLRLYSRGLTQSEIQSDMNTAVGTPVLNITQPLPGASIISSTVNVTYSASGDLSQVSQAEFQLDSNPVVLDQTFDGVYQFTNVPNGDHVLTGWLVRADDTKILGSDATVSFSTSIADSTPPTVSLTAPLNGATESGTIAVTANASDNVGIASVQFLLDGQPLGAADTTAPYLISWDTTTASNTSHTLAARARDLAGNLTTSASITVTVSNSGSNPAVVGQWSGPYTWPLVSVHLNLLPTGKVLAWDNALDTAYTAAVWDPVSNTFTNVSPSVNLFCAGQTQLADGKILVVGGHVDNDIGIKNVTLFDPFTQTWTNKAQMSYARWYPGAMTLADGRVLALEGTTTCKDCIASTPEVYNPATDSWQQLTGAASAFARYFPHSFVLPDGRVLVVGTSQVATSTAYSIPSRVLNLNTQTWTIIDPSTNTDGLSAMYLPGKVVRIGGTWDDGAGFPISATSVLDMTAASPAWRSTAPMRFSRVLHNLTILPDGSVLTTGGSTDAAIDPPASAVIYTAELWNPASETWTTLSNMQTPRLYHSTTALLPDGRVLVAGGGRAFTADQLNAEIFSPPYLFKGTRPTITSAPGQAGYGSTIFVSTPDGARIVNVSLVRLSSTTHTTNFNQRYVPLTFQAVTGGLNVTMPANANLAPLGYYMLFILDGNGVPSVAPFIQLVNASGDTTPPAAPTNLAAAASRASRINLTWTASTDNVGVTGYRIERCQGAGCSTFAQIGTSTSASYSDTGLSASTSYRYRVRATDAAGNLSAYSNTASATTDAPPTAPANMTATASGGTQINLTWTASSSSIGILNYLVERCQGAGCTNFVQIATPTATSYTNTGLTPATTYSYRVRASDTHNNLSGYSNTASAATADTIAPSAPSNLGATAPGSAQINLTWTASTDNVGVTSYLLERCQGAGCSTFAQIATPVSTSYSNTGLTANTSYSYRVRATDAAGNRSGYSNVATATTPVLDTTSPTTPSNLTASAGGPASSIIARQSYINSTSQTTHTTAAFDSTGGDLIVIFGSSHGNVTMTPSDTKGNTWISAAGPKNHLTVDLRSQVWYAKAALVGTGHTVTMNLSAAQPLVISVLVVKGSNTTAPIDVISNITDDGGIATTSITSAAITTTKPADLLIDFAKSNNGVTWTAGSGARFESAASSNYLGAEDLLGASAGAYTASWTTNTAVNWQTVLTGIVSANASASSNQITMTWTPSTDNVAVASYLIERCSGAGCSTFTQIGSTPTTSYTDTALSATSTYVYRIRATDAAGNLSTYSSTASAATTSLDTTPPTAPTNLTATTASAAQINLAWTASTDNVGVTGYRIERCQGTGCSTFAQIGTSTSASYSDTGLSASTSYGYRVRATDGAANLSGYSNTASATIDTPPTAPANLTATASGGTQINLTWTASTSSVGILNYLVERCQGAGCTNFVQLATPVTTSYTDTGLTSATTYSYRVRASDTHNNLGAYSSTASATTADTIAPSVPSNLTATAPASTQINVSWTASTDNVGVTGYLLERCQGAGCSTFTQIATPAGTSYSNTGLTASTSYSYRVRASDAAGNLSSYSNVATATTLASPDTTPPTVPSNLTTSAAGNAQINLTWAASTDNVGVTAYLLERCQGGGCSTFTQIATPAATSYNDIGLTAGTSYSYRVRATDAAGNLSSYSGVASATTTGSSGSVAAYSFDEGTGTTVTDKSGNGNTGTISNGTWTTSGKYGNALVFNGTSSQVTINDSASLHLTTGMTLEAWVYPTVTPGGWVDLIYKQNDNYFLEASSTLGVGPAGGGTFGDGFQTIYGTSPLAVNTWTHVAVTFDGASLRLWLNGVNIATQAQTLPLNASTLPLQIGGDSLYGQYFTGRIDEVRVYNRALTRNELEVDMNVPVGSVSDTTPPTSPANLRSAAGGSPASVIARQAYINSSSLATHTTAAFDSTGGDLIVVFASSHNNVNLTLSDNKGNTWTSLAGPTNHTPGVDLRSQMWYAKSAKVGTGHTATINLSVAQPLVISVFVIKGSNTTSPIDATSGITDDGGIATTSVASANITTTKPADLLIDFVKTSAGVTFTAGSGYTFEDAASSNYLAAEDIVAGAAGSYNAAWTVAPSANWQNVLTSVVSANASASSSQITTSWNPSTDNIGVTGYLIERCTGSGCSTFTQIGSTTGFSTTSYTDTGLSSGTTYTYRVRAKDAAGNLSAYSSTTTATTGP